MSDPTQAILDPRVEVKIFGGKETIMVTEPTWKTLRSFLGKLTATATQLLTFDEKGEAQIDKAAAVKAITSLLADDLILATTGKDAAWLDALPFSDAVRVLNAAVGITLNDEVLDTVKNAASRLRAMGVKAAA